MLKIVVMKSGDGGGGWWPKFYQKCLTHLICTVIFFSFFVVFNKAIRSEFWLLWRIKWLCFLFIATKQHPGLESFRPDSQQSPGSPTSSLLFEASSESGFRRFFKSLYNFFPFEMSSLSEFICAFMFNLIYFFFQLEMSFQNRFICSFKI